MSDSRATAASTTPRNAEASPLGGAVAVAYSGGRDSTALLHATLAAARGTALAVHALHVHHGLNEQADDWLLHCSAQCDRWQDEGLPVRFHACRLQLQPAVGESVEAVARTQRYSTLTRMAWAAGASMVLLAHHRRDQAETWLLQALRGAGAAGLAAMPAVVRRHGIAWARPWLAQPSASIAAYIREHRLHHIEDGSNADPRFARNRLRLAVWPSLEAAFPQAEAAFADAAQWAQQARACEDDLAAIDLASCGGDVLNLVRWRRLAPHRASNALRAWIHCVTGQPASASWTLRLMRELAGTAPASWPLEGGTLRRYRGFLSFERYGVRPPAAEREHTIDVQGEGCYAVPGWGGMLVARAVDTGGVAPARLRQLRLAPRSGGERFQLALGRPARPLKKQFQSADLPAWARTGPLFWSGADLVFVPGLGVDARVWADPGTPQLALDWAPGADQAQQANRACEGAGLPT